MLATLIPLFDEHMMVRSYSVFSQKDNYFLSPQRAGSARFDGIANIAGLDVIDHIGIDALSDGREVFVEVNNISLFADIPAQCKAPHDKIVLLMDPSVTPEQNYVDRITALKKMGYKMAFRKLALPEFENYRPILSLMDYFLIDHKKVDMNKVKIYFDQRYPDTKLCAVNVESQADYDRLCKDAKYHYYEGSFFRMPVTKAQTEVAPLKVNYINLLNVVNNDDFDLSAAADVIGQDAALVISLLSMVNRMTVNSEITSVRHAAAMLGQKELKKWINTAVTRELCADKPSEITRVSMIRAKFAENLAPLFEMGGLAPELFLMGLFSVLDIMLDKPLPEALSMVNVSKSIEKALLQGEGEMMPVYTFIQEYENASWQEVSRLMIVENLDMDRVYEAYVKALQWYRDLLRA